MALMSNVCEVVFMYMRVVLGCGQLFVRSVPERFAKHLEVPCMESVST